MALKGPRMFPDTTKYDILTTVSLSVVIQTQSLALGWDYNLFLFGLFGKRGFSWNRIDGDNNQNHSDEQQNNSTEDLTAEEKKRAMVQRIDEATLFISRLIKEKQRGLSGKSNSNKNEFI
ncbi:hypothetical protein HOLleu_19953 [Holothuria leucospilota]|uniref:Uncharacterized protein n=1 Tax=Holothuria leucospilota TaxID=206669 RepID=A0A9Q1C0C6_HOLLE|nr:hypothetical protein HOLleu_19953 [Holothuria leucospilota]